MSLRLTCPGCRDAVVAAIADRGKKIKCGTCWADVDVPPAEAPVVKASTIPTAKAIPTAPTATPVATASPAGPKKATPLPATAAKPATALPLPPAAPVRTATPVEPRKARPADEDAPKKSRFKERGGGRYDDDDDDDRSKKSGKKGVSGVMVAFICIAVVLGLGLVGGGIAIIVNSKPADSASAPTTDAQPTTPHADPVPGPKPGTGPQPGPGPAAVRPAGWEAFSTKNFACDMPGKVNRGATAFDFATRKVSGTEYTASEQGDAIKVTVKEVILPAGTSPTNPAFLAQAFGVPEDRLVPDPTGRRLGDHQFAEFTARADDGSESVLLATAASGRKGFLFRFQWSAAAADAVTKRDTFLGSVEVLLPAETVVAGGGQNDPTKPKPITKAWELLETKDGVSVQLPQGVKKPVRVVTELENRGGTAGGKRWEVDDGDVGYHLFVHDLSIEQKDVDLKRLMLPALREVNVHNLKTDEETTIDGKPAVRWEIDQHGVKSAGVSVRVGYRVFTVCCVSTAFGGDRSPATVTDRQDRVFNSLKFTFDPKAYVPYADEPAWVPMSKTLGFTALLPKAASTTSADSRPFVFADTPAGKEWKAESDGIEFQVTVIDFTPGPRKSPFGEKTPDDLVEKLRGHFEKVSGPDKVKAGTLDADGYAYKQGDQQVAHLRTVMVGKVMYCLKTTRSGRWEKKCSDKEYDDKSEKFFASFRVGNVVAQPGGGGGEMPVGNPGDFVKVADGKVQPFWTGVFLPQSKEFMTFGVKDAAARPTVKGVLRRYSVPDFKLKATYTLPNPVNRAVADETGGKLYVTTVREVEDAKLTETDAWYTSGELQQYDLRKLTDDAVGEGEVLKPTATLIDASWSYRISGLHAAPDRSAVYLCGWVVGGTKARPVVRGGKLMKWDVAAGKLASEIPTDGKPCGLDVAGDGKKVAVVERSLDDTKGGGNLLVLDGAKWALTKTVPLTGILHDVTAGGELLAAVASAGPGQGKLLVGATDGDTTEVNAGGDANYARFTPDGKRLLVAAGMKTTGLTLFDVAAGKPAKLTKVATAAELGGLFVISPDGKLAVLNAGVVLDLDKSKAK